MSRSLWLYRRWSSLNVLCFWFFRSFIVWNMPHNTPTPHSLSCHEDSPVIIKLNRLSKDHVVVFVSVSCSRTILCDNYYPTSYLISSRTPVILSHSFIRSFIIYFLSSEIMDPPSPSLPLTPSLPPPHQAPPPQYPAHLLQCISMSATLT